VTDPALVPLDAAAGVRAAISVSDSADLARLGLNKGLCELAVAELTRAILLAGGTVSYGGRLDPEGFTHILMDEVRRYADGRNALTICLAEAEHRKLTDDQIDERCRDAAGGSGGACVRHTVGFRAPPNRCTAH
jgi:SLOG-like protein